MILLGMMLLMNLIIVFVVILSLVRIISGQMFAENTGTSDPGALLAAIIIPACVTFIGFAVNFMYPAIHIKPGCFRIGRLFYKSPWFEWQDIHSIQTHWLSNRFRRMTGITLKGLPLIFGYIGAFGLFEMTKGFLVADTIENYEKLLHLLRSHRPDLFE